MSFDKPTRNLLAKMVATCRDRLAGDISDQLQTSYGLYPDGTVLDLATTADDQQAAADLLALLRHYEAQLPANPKNQSKIVNPKSKMVNPLAYQRLVREIGFTTLNRLAALRLAEERGLVIECVRQGMSSDGFQLFDRLAGGALGQRARSYRAFLENLFDELALDLGLLFDRHNPLSAIFPGEAALTEVLEQLNDPELAARGVWQQDETIGWIYQYYNDPAERKAMRDASQAPRNSRELAVRNQFFTPRYVVEFLTDNTLGRTWYEMRRGDTRLVEACRYLVRRAHPIFLADGQTPPEPYDPARHPPGDPDLPGEMWSRPNPELGNLADILAYGLTVNGYQYAPEHLGMECAELANERLARYQESGQWTGNFEELRCCLFFEQRRWRHFGADPDETAAAAIRELHAAINRCWEQEVEVIPYRDKKDPRRLKILDPACGSGHFLLYCFDLLLTIYQEAYSDPRLGPELQRAYPSLDDLTRAAPELIVRHNLHGLDIDPRAAQIAALALWLRVQRAWQAQKLPSAQRPSVTRSNIVVAEPMPGDPGLLDDFARRLPADRRDVLGYLLRTIVDKMELAGEAGALLKIEAELDEAIKTARKLGRAQRELKQGILPDYDLPPATEQLTFDWTAPPDDDAFWQTAEKQALEALQDYAEQSENGVGTQRRLFAGDAARGFAFIDLCRHQFDIILMNPPYGDPSYIIQNLLRTTYQGQPNDLFACFIERAIELSKGFIGALTSRTFLNYSSFSKFRDDLMGHSRIDSLLDLGFGVLDEALVEVCATVLRLDTALNNDTHFFQMLDISEKSSAIKSAINSISQGERELYHFQINQKVFELIKDKPMPYWAGKSILNRLSEWSTIYEKIADVRLGVLTGSNEQFLRLRWEIGPHLIDPNLAWASYSKGGDYNKYYNDIHLVIDWRGTGEHMRRTPRANVRLREIDQYLRPGLTYPLITVKGVSIRTLPANCVFDNVSPSIFPYSEQDLILLLGLLNSRIVELYLRCFTSSRAWQVGYMRRLPWPRSINSQDKEEISVSAQSALNCARFIISTMEPSTEYLLPSLLSNQISITLGQSLSKTLNFLDDLRQKFRNSDDLCNKIAGKIYKFTEEEVEILDRVVPSVAKEYDQFHDSFWNKGSLVGDLISYFVGCSFERWDIRLALDPTLAPTLQDPFDPLPVCPPGMLVGPEGLPATSGQIVSEAWLRARPNAITLPPSPLPPTGEGSGVGVAATIPDEQYPLPLAWDGILVDDPDHPVDIVGRVRGVLALLWPDSHEAIEAEACEILGVKELRDYFRRPSAFFADHLKRYSKSRRQAPIYWPLSTPSGSYTLWLYYHRLTDQTLYTAVNRYVGPKIEQVERQVAALEVELNQALGRSGAATRDELDSARASLSELRQFRDELLRLAGLPYQPNLNDGVIINAAPLHKLFGLTKWSRDTAAVWKKLQKGEYDWAHLAYTLWPERVREVCKQDRSIAIAHGLEELCEVEPPKSKKQKGKRKAKAKVEAETIEMEFEDEK